MNLNKIYMVHYSPLVDRRQRILETIDFDMEWIISEPTEQYWTTDKQTWDYKVTPTAPHRELRQSEISLSHKHVEVYKDIVKNQYERCLVLEDDVVLDPKFDELFDYQLGQTPDDWDFIFIGSGCNLRVPPERLKSSQTAYKMEHPASKCTDSYCITLSAAERILETIIPFTFPIDFELNYQMKLHDMNVYWWEPPLVRQGSQCGLYDSEIQ
jgi:GR25 family glycosyltransferase involved in LPS biosynthesis